MTPMPIQKTTLFDFSDDKVTVKVVGATQEETQKIPANVVSKLSGNIYSLEHSLKYIEGDPYFFDMRYWKGMTRAEVKERWDSGEWHTNSGHGEYQLRSYKLQGGSFKALWEIIKENRVKHWKWWYRHECADAEDHRKRLTKYLNMQACESGCIACEKECGVKDRAKKESESFIEWSIKFHRDCMNRNIETSEMYASLLRKHGVDPKQCLKDPKKAKK